MFGYWEQYLIVANLVVHHCRCGFFVYKIVTNDQTPYMLDNWWLQPSHFCIFIVKRTCIRCMDWGYHLSSKSRWVLLCVQRSSTRHWCMAACDLREYCTEQHLMKLTVVFVFCSQRKKWKPSKMTPIMRKLLLVRNNQSWMKERFVNKNDWQGNDIRCSLPPVFYRKRTAEQNVGKTSQKYNLQPWHQASESPDTDYSTIVQTTVHGWPYNLQFGCHWWVNLSYTVCVNPPLAWQEIKYWCIENAT